MLFDHILRLSLLSFLDLLVCPVAKILLDFVNLVKKLVIRELTSLRAKNVITESRTYIVKLHELVKIWLVLLLVILDEGL